MNVILGAVNKSFFCDYSPRLMRGVQTKLAFSRFRGQAAQSRGLGVSCKCPRVQHVLGSIAYSKGLTLLEALISSAMMVFIFSMLSNILLLAYSIKIKQQYYNDGLSDARYIYWLFYNQVIERAPVQNIDSKKLDGERLSVSILQTQHYQPIEIYSYKELARVFTANFSSVDKTREVGVDRQWGRHNESKYFLKLKDRINPISSVLKIKHLTYNGEQSEIVQDKFIYYVARSHFEPSSYSLYQLHNYHSEELISYIKSFNVERYGNCQNTYKFSIVFSRPYAIKYSLKDITVTFLMRFRH